MNGFREKFVFPQLTTANWFPGHMAKGLRLISRRIRYCDCVVELRDARIPISGVNDKFNLMLKGKPKILVLNKKDLCDQDNMQVVLNELRRFGENNILYTNLRSQHHPSIKNLMSLILKVSGWDRSAEMDKFLRLMVVGLPNVGKSSLINALRRIYLKKGKGAGVGKIPGITRSVTTKIKVSDSPAMYLVDTPGVMMPSIPSDEVALKLAATGMLRDHFVGEALIVDYLLFMLNKNGKFEYAEYCGLEKPCDDINAVLDKMSQRIGALQKGGTYDHTRAAQHFLKRFREGQFGQITFDNFYQ